MSFNENIPYQSNQLPISIDLPIENSKLKYMVQESYSRIVHAVNSKVGGIFQSIETATFQEFFINELQIFNDVYRIQIPCGTLPDNSSISIPHNLDINDDFILVKIYGTANDTSNFSYIPLPFASQTLNENISLSVDRENVIITTGSSRSNYTQTYVIIEYVKG